jgi:pilus assembly protein CpaB
MKWSILVLIVLGLLAAFSTAILIGSLRASPSGSSGKSSASDIEVALFTTSLPAMSVITSKHITISMASKKDLPDGYISEPVQIIGRILATPVVEGQILTKSCFVAKGSAAQLAAAIPYGMRAISIVVSNNSITGGLLYPGSVVDILASFRLSSKDRGKGQAISTTLLQGIQVLAVDNISVVSKRDDKKDSTRKASYSGNRTMRVTLMVNPRQAEALQLAQEYGRVSVAMRNPLDRNPVDSDTTVLSEGQLAKYGSMMTPAVLTSQQKIDFLEKIGRKEQPKEQSPRWGVTVIRGRDVQVQELDISK